MSENTRRALVTGAAGMDGRHLVRILHEAGVPVWGMLRHPDHPRRRAVEDRGARIVVADLLDTASLRAAIAEVEPTEVHHLAALSAPGVAWQQPEHCAQVTALGTLRLLQAVQDVAPRAAVIVAGSLATHGPYGAAKTYARAIAADYRQRGMHVSTMVMGGHHSPLRGATYLSQKVALHARSVGQAMSLNSTKAAPRRLQLGWLGRLQDWGWAPDFMRVWADMPMMEPDDYTLSTGLAYTVQDYVAACYMTVGARWLDWVDLPLGGNVNPNATDVDSITAKPDERLGFESTCNFAELVRRMVTNDYFE